MSARADLRSILDAALAAVDPRAVVERALRIEGEVLRVAGTEEVRLGEVRRVWVVGAGKGAAGMAEAALAALAALGDRVAGGSISVPDGLGRPLGPLAVWEARHPIPDARGLAGAAEALRVARGAGEGDLLLCLLSGGASALWPAPPVGVTLGDLQAATETLLRSGAPIVAVNAVRKHLSRIAGGRLAREAAPARVLTLAISDVVEARADTIGSGPTVPDRTTYAEALQALAGHEGALPPAVLRHLQTGAAGDLPETPKPGELGENVSFHVVAGLRDALAAAAEEATRLGYHARVVSDALQGEARAAGSEIALAALRAARENDGAGPIALLWGGETTVTVRGAGRGGRNQEMALAAALALDGQPGVTLACFGTDGIDGNTDAAGAVIDGSTLARARAAGLDPARALRDNDSHPLLRAAGDLLITGRTGTNVNDLAVAVVD